MVAYPNSQTTKSRKNCKMITYSEIRAKLTEMDKPEEIKKVGHVWEVWEDGEITMTKSGPIYGLRGLHCMTAGGHVSLPLECFPRGTRTDHRCIAVASEVEARDARAFILKAAIQLTKQLA